MLDKLKQWAITIGTVDLEYKRKIALCNTVEELDEVVSGNVADHGRLNLLNLSRLLKIWIDEANRSGRAFAGAK